MKTTCLHDQPLSEKTPRSDVDAQMQLQRVTSRMLEGAQTLEASAEARAQVEPWKHSTENSKVRNTLNFNL